MPAYQPQRRGHYALAHLESGSADLTEIALAIDAALPTSRNKAYHIMQSLIEDGFVSIRQGEYRLTEDGDRALERLRAGETVDTRPVQSVRIFGRAA